MSVVLSSRLHSYLLLIRFDKPIGSILLMWPTLWGLWVANSGAPSLQLIIIFLVGVLLMRSAGCIINDVADRNFDGGVARTASRPLVISDVSVRLSTKSAICLFVILCSIAFLLVLSLHNTLLIIHSLIAFLLACLYPFCKRFFDCPQFILGLAFGYAIPMAFVASYTPFSTVTWLLYGASIMLTIIYDTFYAMSDIADDKKLGLKSSAIWFERVFGKNDLLAIWALQVLFVIDLLFLAHLLNFKFYNPIIIVVLFLFIYQIKLASTRKPEHCLMAFRNSSWVGAIVFLWFMIEYL